jgi:hypothetical protein
MPSLQLKFRDGAPEEERASVLERIKASRAKPERLFPGESDPELASMYTVNDVPEGEAAALTRDVGAHEAVEFIEPAAARKLIG